MQSRGGGDLACEHEEDGHDISCFLGLIICTGDKGLERDEKPLAYLQRFCKIFSAKYK